jgi:hypothetical protein
MGKQRKAKAQSRALHHAVTSPAELTWHDNEVIHIIAPGVQQPGDEEKMTENFQKQNRN